LEGKYVVATGGVVCVAAIEVTNIIMKGPDTTIVAAVVGAITAIVGFCFGKAVS